MTTIIIIGTAFYDSTVMQPEDVDGMPNGVDSTGIVRAGFALFVQT